MTNIREVWKNFTQGTTQVLLCDLQKQIVARSKTTPHDAMTSSARVLCEFAKLFQLPLTLSVVPEGQKPPELAKDLHDFATPANQFLRANANPFLNAKTKQRLADQHRKTLILCGFAIEVVVLHAALSALDEGYNVLVAIDACGGMSTQTESAAVEHIRQSGGIITSVTTIGTALAPDFTSKQGQQMFEIVQTLRLA